MPEGYLIDNETFLKLVRIKESLYRDPINHDTKRDLANTLDHILDDIIPLSKTDIEKLEV